MGECQSACNSDETLRAAMEQSIRIEYNGERFIMPEQFSFDKQATFSKVEQAARSFCQRNLESIKKTIYHSSTRHSLQESSPTATSLSSRKCGSDFPLLTAKNSWRTLTVYSMT